jgi:hypothetical protein
MEMSEIMVLLYIYALFLFMTHTMAKVRNRSGVRWLIFGVVASPILAMLALGILGDKENA